MKNPLHKILTPITEVQLIRGIELPVGLEFRQLVVTGPPGAGKTYYINQIRGWPNEGYIDLSRKGWWRDQSLVYRPREIHLGIPYEGFPEALTVFDQEWLDCNPDSLRIDYKRIQIPPRKHRIFSTNWIDKYIFEFFLPDEEQIYHQRLSRQTQGFFPVDANLTLDMVVRQSEAYSQIALYLHRAGLNVYVRKKLDEPPMLISEKGNVALPPWAIAEPVLEQKGKFSAIFKKLVLLQNHIPWFNLTNQLQMLDGPARISHDGKDFDLVVGKHHFRLSPEMPLGARKSYMRRQKNWLIKEPYSCSVKAINGFARIRPGETVLIGRANQEYNELFGFKKDVAKRHLTVTNTKGDLLIRPLDSEKKVRVVRLDEQDNREKLAANRIAAMLHIRSIFGGPIDILNPAKALSLVLEINQIMTAEPYRCLDENDLPGGLVEIPDKQTPVIVGDLHGNVNNLLKILTENCLLEAMKADKAILCILGDAVHSEIANEMEKMEGSILMMDLIFSLKKNFPANLFYIRGNHDSFTADLAKNGIPQGLLMKKALKETRGPAYVEAMETFYDSLPYMIVSESFISCHAGPPRTGTTRKQIVNLRDDPNIAGDLTRNRPKRPNYLSGYGKSDIKSLRKVFKKPKSTPVIVGHTPLDPFGSIWQNVTSIKNHHIVYSSHQEGPAFFVRIRNKITPLSYPSEPLIKLINRIKE